MPTTYIAAPYTSKAFPQKDREVGIIESQSYKNFLGMIESAIKQCGLKVILPQRDVISWGSTDETLENLGKRVMEDIKSCDVLVAYPEDSRGVNIIIGWAVAQNKPIIILLNERERISYAYLALSRISNTRIVVFRDTFDMKLKLQSELSNLLKK